MRVLIAQLVLITLTAILAGCASKRLVLYNPQTGQKLAEYVNTSDTEIAGIKAKLDMTAGTFGLDVVNSSQNASGVNQGILDLGNRAIELAAGRVPLTSPTPARSPALGHDPDAFDPDNPEGAPITNPPRPAKRPAGPPSQ